MVQRSVLTGAGVAVASVLIFLGVTAITLEIPPERVLHEIRAGFDEGSILRQNYPQPKDYWRLGRDQWTDCATLQMALRGDAPFYQELITPRRYSLASADPARGPCQLLREATDPAGSPADLQTWRYHRYLHGSTVLTRIALWTTSVNGLRDAIKISTLCFGGFALAVALWSLVSNRRRPAHALATVSLVAVFLACFGISQHAASISHGPSAALFILALSLIPFWDGGKWNRLLVIAALFGSATAILEFLDGGAPLGLALILGMSVLDALEPVETGAGPRDSAQIFQRGVSTALAFTTAVVTALGLKVVLSRLAFGGEGSSSFFDQLVMWIGGSPLLAVEALEALDKQVGVIVPLNDTAFRVLVIGLAAGCTFVLLKMKNLRGGGGTVLLAVGSLAIVPVWYLIFRNHTIVHAWFMVRMLAWPLAFCAGLIVWWLVSTSTPVSWSRQRVSSERA
ncbi:MAG: hypothetical protein HOP16_11910 [Acidobacteria bacterium]|nr:hypothetical protein [Acidobacteriota bacterium]